MATYERRENGDHLLLGQRDTQYTNGGFLQQETENPMFNDQGNERRNRQKGAARPPTKQA